MSTLIKGWSDAEKVAVLLSIIRTSGVTPAWKNLPLPVGRTLGATQKMYEKIREAGDAVPMNSPEKVPAARARGAPATPRRAVKKNGKNSASDGDSEDTMWGTVGGVKLDGKRKRGAEKGAAKGKKGAKKAKVVTDEEVAGDEDGDAVVKKEMHATVDDEEDAA